jgi:hypothetical protein
LDHSLVEASCHDIKKIKQFSREAHVVRNWDIELNFQSQSNLQMTVTLQKPLSQNYTVKPSPNFLFMEINNVYYCQLLNLVCINR